jgi:hypothetical protein
MPIKTKIFKKFFCLLFIVSTFTLVFKDVFCCFLLLFTESTFKKFLKDNYSLRSPKTIEIKVFLKFVAS